MEESSEKRRERLRAMREEASLANDDEERGGSYVATPPDPAGIPLPSDLQQAAPSSPSPAVRFEFYTDPLAAFSGSQKKKKPKNSLGSPYGGAPASAHCKSPPSPFWQPDFSGLNHNLHAPGNLNTPWLPNPYPNLPPPGNFSTPGPSNPNPNPHPFTTGYPGSFNTPNSNPHNNSNYSPHHSRGKFTPNSTPRGSFNTPGSNPNTTPIGGYSNPGSSPFGGYSNPGSSMHGPQSAFGSPQPLSESQLYNGGGSGGLLMNSPAPNQYNPGRGGFSTGSPQHRSGGMNDVRNNGWNQSGINSSRSQGSNRSRGSFMQSPSRDNRTPGRSGGRGFQRAEASASTNPELFFKRSMLLDPWKDLVPVRLESVTVRLNSCSVAGSRDWLPKSVGKGTVSPNTKGVAVPASGPSLAESLEACRAAAVTGEDGD